MDRKQLINKILQSLKENKQPRLEDFDIEESVWNSTASYLKEEGYIKSITISRNTQYMFAELTEKGYKYLEQL